MPNNASEEPSPPAGEAAPAPVSTPAGSVAEAADQLASTKLSDQDEAKPPTDAGETKPKEDPELWKPLTPTEECPVCMVPLPLENGNCTYWACCSKRVCTACSKEHERAQRVTNMKREKKKQPPLEKTCAFCRTPLPRNDAEEISRYEEKISKDDTRAMINLAGMYLQGAKGLRKNDEKAFELLNRAADLGSLDAIALLGQHISFGHLDNIKDESIGREYLKDSAVKGNVHSQHSLGTILYKEGNIALAIKHWNLAAAAGQDQSMKGLWSCFNKGKLSKPDLEKALRAHKAARDEMNSEQRERWDAYKEAKGGNDQLLKDIYTMYYAGYINVKELKKALQAHRSGNRREATMLIRNKIFASGVDVESLEEQARLAASSYLATTGR